MSGRRTPDLQPEAAAELEGGLTTASRCVVEAPVRREAYETRKVVVRLQDVSEMIREAERTGGVGRPFTRVELKHCGTRMRCLGARLVIKQCVHSFLWREARYTQRDYQEVEVENNHAGKPFVRLSGLTRDCARGLDIVKILASLSHSRSWIAAMLVFCYSARPEHWSQPKEAS